MRLKDLFFKAGNFFEGRITRNRTPVPFGLADQRSDDHTFNVAKAMEAHPDHNLVLRDLDDVVVHNIRNMCPRGK